MDILSDLLQLTSEHPFKLLTCLSTFCMTHVIHEGWIRLSDLDNYIVV